MQRGASLTKQERHATRVPLQDKSLPSSGLAFPILLHEGQRIAAELFFSREHAAPNLGRSRQVRQCESKGFDNEPTAVASLLQRLEGGREVDVSLAGRRTIVL